MKEKLIFSVLVDNQSGVLQRVASLFSRTRPSDLLVTL